MNQVELSIEEISDAENHLIKKMQKKEFKEEYLSLIKKKELPTHSKLLGLYPKLDSEGIIRADGRLTYAEFLPYDVWYPIVLPRKSWITKLIVKYHELGNHIAGTNQILSSFMTIKGRGKPRQKRYLCLFTCLASRAVHLEMACGLDVESFLNALNRMINRRGVPEEIWFRQV